jgi:hypothetical protein
VTPRRCALLANVCNPTRGACWPRVFLCGTRDATTEIAMRYEDHEDPKKPRPVPLSKKHSNAREAVESGKLDRDRDRHMHVSA